MARRTVSGRAKIETPSTGQGGAVVYKTRTEARAEMSEILDMAASGEEIRIGSRTSAHSCFTSPAAWRKSHPGQDLPSTKLDVDTLRRRWKTEREIVEGSGRPVLVTRRGDGVAVLWPTRQGVRKRVEPIAAALAQMTQGEVIEKVVDHDARIEKLERLVEELREPAEIGAAFIDLMRRIKVTGKVPIRPGEGD